MSEVAGVGILVASTGATYTIAWPSDAEPRTLARVGLGGSLLGVIGTGREAVILLLDQIIGRAYEEAPSWPGSAIWSTSAVNVE